MKNIRKIIITILICIILICSFFIGKYIFFHAKELKEIKEIQNIVKETTKDEDIPFNKEAFNKLKEQNEDLVGYLIWDSGIIEQPVVQSYDNNFYLRRNFNKNYYDGGVPYMDYRNSLDDDNITIYGHNYDTEPNVMFSPLNNFIDNNDYYKENATFKLYTENNIREYIVMYAYLSTNADYQVHEYTRNTFINEKDYNDFIQETVDRNTIMPLKERIKYGNKFITLQTCKQWNSNYKVIIVAKEILRKDYE